MIAAAPALSTTAPSQDAPSGQIVFVVDDDISVREALDVLLQSEGFTVETFINAHAFLARPRAAQPSCLILDYSLPEINGLVLQERMTSERPEMPIIFITGFADVPMTIRAMKAGAVEFLTKPFDDNTLLDAVRAALRHSQAVLRCDADAEALRACYASLTPRERAVLALITAGLRNKLVASELGISEITVKAHRGKVMRKMNARSLPELVRMAARLPAHCELPNTGDGRRACGLVRSTL